MNILHIATGFAQSTVYLSTVNAIAASGHTQTIYAPVRSVKEKQKKIEFDYSSIQYFPDLVLEKRDRIFFRKKIKKLGGAVDCLVNVSSFDVVHAHTLFSDGGVALYLYARYKIPYVVTVRNTDLNVFMKYRPDLVFFMREVIRNAKKVIFLNSAYKYRFLRRMPIGSKAEVVPNGIAADWISSERGDTSGSDDTLKVLYVGDFSKNKNILNLVKAVKHISMYRKVKLTLVGDDVEKYAYLKNYLSCGNVNFLESLGRISDVKRLRSVYQGHDVFAMASKTESFGLVYLEALSQGVPVVHSKGEGVDGYFEGKDISFSVDPKNPLDIARGIECLSRFPATRQRDCQEVVKDFSWEKVAEKLVSCYRRS